MTNCLALELVVGQELKGGDFLCGTDSRRDGIGTTLEYLGIFHAQMSMLSWITIQTQHHEHDPPAKAFPTRARAVLF